MTARKRTQPKRTAAKPSATVKPSDGIKISLSALGQIAGVKESVPFQTYQPAPGVVPVSKLSGVLAMDATPYDYISQQSVNNGFPGYPALSELAQIAEYRKMVSTLAEEMSRKWIKLQTTGDEKSEKIELLDAAIRKFKLREHFRKVMEHDGYFGRGQLYVDMKSPGGAMVSDDDKELQAPLFLSDKKVTKDSLQGFRVVEAMWTYPNQYQSTSPLKKGFYEANSWYVMGQIVHTSRMLMFISRPVPDMLKAAYSFGGMSLSQLAQPYISHWIRTRNSVSDIVHSFSVSGIATNLEATLAGGNGSDLMQRAQLFNATRDNRGLMMLDKESEEFFQFNTPLSGLDSLQAQAQEQMSAVSSIPLVKLLGVTPAGLNSSSDGEIRVFYDFVHSMQEIHREPLKKAIELIQLSEFGEIDPDIDFSFEPLYQLSELEMATARKSDADTDAVYIQAGVISGEDSRTRLAADPDSPYHGLDLSDDSQENDNPETEPTEEEEGDPTERADTERAARS